MINFYRSCVPLTSARERLPATIAPKSWNCSFLYPIDKISKLFNDINKWFVKLFRSNDGGLKQLILKSQTNQVRWKSVKLYFIISILFQTMNNVKIFEIIPLLFLKQTWDSFSLVANCESIQTFGNWNVDDCLKICVISSREIMPSLNRMSRRNSN